jgi:hypothetical protein
MLLMVRAFVRSVGGSLHEFILFTNDGEHPLADVDDRRVMSLTVCSIAAMRGCELLQSFPSRSAIYCPHEQQIG